MKNKILKATAYIMAFIFVFSVCAVDSDSIIPSVLCIISLSWLALFALANQKRMTGGD